MKNTALFCSLVLCYSGLAGAAESQEASLEGILRQPGISETLLPHLTKQELGSLSRVSRLVHEAAEPAIVTAMEKAAIWESYVLNARDLDLSSQRQHFHDNQAFKDYAIQRIKDFAMHNPGTWIKLNLSRNSLGNDLVFLKDLLQAIVTTVHSLKIDLASLDLFDNHLAHLPRHLFKGLNNLQKLDLSGNDLKHLRENRFKI